MYVYMYMYIYVYMYMYMYTIRNRITALFWATMLSHNIFFVSQYMNILANT
jgi:hypothetical protein